MTFNNTLQHYHQIKAIKKHRRTSQTSTSQATLRFDPTPAPTLEHLTHRKSQPSVKEKDYLSKQIQRCAVRFLFPAPSGYPSHH